MDREPLGWPALLGMGIVLAVLVAGGAGVGWWLDGVLHTSPILVVVGIGLGVVTGIGYAIVQIRPFLKN
jgi:F0F1-type ATP synthase assembly protein I